MSRLWYLRSHVVWFVCDVLAIVFLAAFLPALGVERDSTVLVVLVVGLLLLVPGLHGYLRERALVRQLANMAEQATEALERASLLAEPGFVEGDVTVRALQEVARDGRARTEDARAGSERYRLYVESWVHEIKTPLAAMRLFLANHKDPSLRPLSLELDRVERLVEQTLYYARSFSVERDYVIREHDLRDIVRRAVRSRSAQLIEAHMSVSLDGFDEGTLVPCDEKWCEFILGQVIDNAVRYRCDSERDGRSPLLEFRSRTEGAGTARERVVLEVRDNGCGITTADLPRVFEHGFTGDNGRAHERSTGMGLYLVRTLCERMGLAVGIASEQGEWTCVDVTFPSSDT